MLDMKNRSTNSVVPEGELRCVWMDAGVSSFKLCDQEFRCETCTFNMNVTRQNREEPILYTQYETQRSADNDAMTADVLFSTVLKKRLDSIRANTIPRDRIYNHGQFWIQQIASGTYRVGINHILANFFQPILSIVISKVPGTIHRLDPFCWIILPGGAITLRSPIQATITRFNPALQEKPHIVSTDPFQDGWIMEITAKSKELSSFTSSAHSKQLVKRTLHNIEHIFNQTFHNLQPTAGTTLFDGGNSSDTIENILGPTIYRDVVNRITHLPM